MMTSKTSSAGVLIHQEKRAGLAGKDFDRRLQDLVEQRAGFQCGGQAATDFV